MFTLPSDGNPLASLLSAAVGGAQAHHKQQAQEGEVQRVLGGLTAESSPMDWFRAIQSVRDPEVKQQISEGYQQFQNAKKAESLQQKSQPNQGQIDKDFGVIEKYLGPEVAELYSTATSGGKTQLLRQALEAQQRGQSLGDRLGNTKSTKQSEEAREGEWPTINPPSDLTPKEVPQWRKQNKEDTLPEYKKAAEKNRSWKATQSDYKHLSRLSDKLPDGLSRLIINPQTGEPYEVARLAGAVKPEVEEWVKIIANQSAGAKDTYGGRVTNFDLSQFLKRYPGLLNSKEGRTRIIEQMQIVGEMNHLYDNAFTEVVQKYGIGNIPFVEADRLAQEKIAPKVEELEERRELIGAEVDSNEEFSRAPPPPASKAQITEAKKQLNPGYTLMVKPDGKHVAVKNDKVAQRSKEGYSKL